MTETELKSIIIQQFLEGDAEYPLDARTQLLEEGICDSLGLVQLVARIEERSPGIRIRDQEITRDNFGSIASILKFLASRKKAA